MTADMFAETLADAISVVSILRATKRSGNRLLAADSASYLY